MNNLLKVNLKFLLYLQIVLLFFPAFVFDLPSLGGLYAYFYIVLYINLFLLVMLKRQQLFITLATVSKNTPLKHLLLTILLVILNSLILSCFSITTISQTIRSVFLRIILAVFPFLMFFTFIIVKKYITYKKFIRILSTLIWIILILGIVSFIAMFFDINIINKLFEFFANSRVLKYSIYNVDWQANEYSAYGLPRVSNLYEEPSFYATFLFLFLPFIYTIGQYIEVHENKYLKVMRQTVVPLAWINILMTQSPIFFILSLLCTVLYFRKRIIQLFKRYSILILFIFVTICIWIWQFIDVDTMYLSRIMNLLKNVKSFEAFILIEPSLATRIISFINTYCIFFNNPIFGVGIGNVDKLMLNQLMQSPITLTPELIRNVNFALLTQQKTVMYNNGLIYYFLASHGLLITSIFVYFNINLFNKLLILQKKINDHFIYSFARGLKYCLINLFVMFFYQFNILQRELWMIYLLCILLLYISKKERIIYEEDNING